MSSPETPRAGDAGPAGQTADAARPRSFDAVLAAEPAADAEPAAGADPGRSREHAPRLEDAPAPEAPRPLLRIDAWWGRVLANPAAFRLWYWGGPIGVALLALVLRVWNLGHPSTLVFDEIYYVRDAYSQWVNGAPTSWPSGLPLTMDPDVLAQLQDAGSYAVHPPLGKWIIGLGMWLFGASDPVGWRIATAVLGSLIVLLIALITRKLLGSTLLAVIAGLLVGIDGIDIVMSRVALLDGVLAFFVVAGFGLIVLDRAQLARLWAQWESEQAGIPPERRGDWGPVFWRRPWLYAAGIVFGLACGVKWNGLYFLAGMGVYLVVADMIARRRHGLRAWFSAGILTQGLASFVMLVPLAVVSYLATWTGWLLSSDGWDRDWADTDGNAATGFWSWVPRSLQSLWHYHQQMYQWHSTLDQPHPYATSPLGWPILLRPTSMYYQGLNAGSPGCDSSVNCAQAITSISNPLIWWGALVAGFVLVWLLLRRRDGASGLVLAILGGGYLPWIAAAWGRSAVFEFYTVSYAPFMAIALAIVLGRILGSRHDPPARRLVGIRVVAIFLAAAVLLSAFFYPIWTGLTVPFPFWQLHMWFPSWV